MTILHVYQDRRDPLWQVIDENGRTVFTGWNLKDVRQKYGTLRRGAHPTVKPPFIARLRHDYDYGFRDSDYSVYWLEKAE